MEEVESVGKVLVAELKVREIIERPDRSVHVENEGYSHEEAQD